MTVHCGEKNRVRIQLVLRDRLVQLLDQEVENAPAPAAAGLHFCAEAFLRVGRDDPMGSEPAVQAVGFL